MITASKAPASAKRLIAPCTRDCPAGIDVPRYIGYVVQGKFGEAEAVVREHNPLPGVCGYVCYRPCEPGCRRSSMEAPVAINRIKRAAHDLGDKVWRARWDDTIAEFTGKRVAVVGSGPAGLTAAYYLGKRCGHSVTVFEALPEAGGQLRIGIPAYRLPRHVLDKEIRVTCETRVELRTNHRVASLDELFAQGFDVVYLALGTCEPNAMGIEGEDLPGVMRCVEFLQAVNLGWDVSVGRRVAVIGGGNVAIDGVRTALRMGAQQVAIVYRRSRNEMPAYDFEVHEAEVEGARLEFLVAPQRITQEDDHLRLHLQRMQLGEPDESGRRRPVPIPGDVFSMEVDTVLAAIGQHAGTPQDWGLDLNRDGTIKVDSKTFQTSREGVFAGGDVVTGAVNVIEAIAGARKAAESIDRYLGGSGDVAESLAPAEGDEMHIAANIQPLGVEALPMPELEPATRIHTFDNVELGYTAEQAKAEARRCLRCDMWRLEGVPAVWPKGKKAT